MSRADAKWSIWAFMGAVALVLVALVAVARYPNMIARGREFHSVFRNAAGLDVGDEVRYGGLVVGSVTKMAFDTTDPTRILVTYKVRKSTPMRVCWRVACAKARPRRSVSNARLGSPVRAS